MMSILLFFFGFIFSFVGSITPSMLNMTALKITIEKDRNNANKYALGVSLMVIPQVYIAAFLTKHLAENPTVIQTLEKAGIFIFILLSYYFYRESKKSKIKVEGLKSKKENPFLAGITLSLLNMFAIPFFCGIIIFLDTFNQFNFDIVPLLFFTLGSILGTFYILFLYGKYAKEIQKKAGRIIKDINLVLSVLTGLVAVITLLKLFI